MPLKTDNAIGLLRILLVASIVVPVLFVLALGWITYRADFDDAERAAIWTSQVAQEHASKVFDSQRLVAARVLDILAGMSDDDIRRSETGLRDRVVALIADFEQIQSLIVVDKNGHPLLASATPLIKLTVDVSDRDYFQALRGKAVGPYISRVQTSRIDGRPFFGLALARRGAYGSFNGVVDVAISPAIFLAFYKTLLSDMGSDAEGRIITLIRSDGQILVRYPPFTGQAPAVKAPNLFFDAIGASPENGTYLNRSIIDRGAPERFYAYRKVPGHPLYIVVGRSLTAILAGWRSRMGVYLAAIVPTTAAFVLVTLAALGRTQREEAAQARARTEIGKRKVAEEALARAQRLEAVGQLTGGIAHDFNNLLTVIVGNVDMMVRRADDPERVRRLGGSVLQAARRVADVTDKLLTFSRRHAVRPEIVDLNALIASVAPLLEQAVQAKVRLKIKLCPGSLPAHIDPGQFEAALINLAINARDAMSEGGALTVATCDLTLDHDALGDTPGLAPGRYAGVSVSDTGSGMDADTIEKAFEPFFTTKDVGKGTGLGLSQVYGFARQSGGSVRIDSAPRQGTTIRLVLPCSDGEPVAKPAGSASAPARSRNGEVILVVEDEVAVLEMATASLEELGYRTLSASDAAGAVDLIERPQRIDLLFTDIAMPGTMDGIALSCEARRIRPDLPILLTSGFSATVQATGVPHGLPFLAKPYLREQLAAEVARLLADPRNEPAP